MDNENYSVYVIMRQLYLEMYGGFRLTMIKKSIKNIQKNNKLYGSSDQGEGNKGCC
jgi:hypothetical protein